MVKAVKAGYLWFLKYAPQAVDEVAGNEDVKEKAKKWALDWNRGRKQKPLFLYGPPGVGKTALAQAIASEFDWNLFDARENVGGLEKLSEKGLLGRKPFVVADCVESFKAGEMRGLSKALREAPCPIVLTSNDFWSPKLKSVRFLCLPLQLKRVNWHVVRKVLTAVAEKEGVECSDELIQGIAREARGDLRSALLDLQASCAGDGREASEKIVSLRDREENIFDVLRAVFKARSYGDAVHAGDNADVDLDFLMKWVDENIPLEYEDENEVKKAYAWISKADVFAGRIKRRQNYSLMRFIRPVGLGGVAASKREPYKKFVRYRFPSSIKKLGETKKNRALLKQILHKIMNKLHCSRREALQTVFFLGGSREATAFFGLSEEEAQLFAEFKVLGHDYRKKTHQKNS